MNVKIRNKFIEIKYSVSYGLGLDSYSRQVFIYLYSVLIYISL